MTFFENFKFGTTLVCKNEPKSCHLVTPLLKKPSEFFFIEIYNRSHANINLCDGPFINYVVSVGGWHFVFKCILHGHFKPPPNPTL